jgi:Domain of unknown function (DUF4265)
MDDKENTELIHVYTGKSDENIVYEEIPAKRLKGNLYQLLSSPGLALNMAKGDIIDITKKSTPAKIIKRGGNFCIQVYSESLKESSINLLAINVKNKLGGSLDGSYMGNLAFSVPAEAGMDNIREVFDDFTNETGVDWYYCNIYKNPENLDDDELLNWWI